MTAKRMTAKRMTAKRMTAKLNDSDRVGMTINDH